MPRPRSNFLTVQEINLVPVKSQPKITPLLYRKPAMAWPGANPHLIVSCCGVAVAISNNLFACPKAQVGAGAGRGPPAWLPFPGTDSWKPPHAHLHAASPSRPFPRGQTPPVGPQPGSGRATRARGYYRWAHTTPCIISLSLSPDFPIRRPKP